MPWIVTLSAYYLTGAPWQMVEVTTPVGWVMNRVETEVQASTTPSIADSVKIMCVLLAEVLCEEYLDEADCLDKTLDTVGFDTELFAFVVVEDLVVWALVSLGTDWVGMAVAETTRKSKIPMRQPLSKNNMLKEEGEEIRGKKGNKRNLETWTDEDQRNGNET
jgi:hypothetical protein